MFVFNKALPYIQQHTAIKENKALSIAGAKIEAKLMILNNDNIDWKYVSTMKLDATIYEVRKFNFGNGWLNAIFAYLVFVF